MVGSPRPSISRKSILEKTTETAIISYYLNLTEIPHYMCSPLRQDTRPSFYVYSPNGEEVNFIDYGTNERGGCFTLLSKLWKIPREDVYIKVMKDIEKFSEVKVETSSAEKVSDYKRRVFVGKNIRKKLEVQTREWQQYDEDYWSSFGISLELLKWADVHPVEYVITTYGKERYVRKAEKYAYAYVEHKEGHTSIKVYQPFSKERKWRNSHDGSVLGLWSKIPKSGKAVFICSSVKDALCLTNNLRVPAICVQGEAMDVSDTALQVLKSRFERIYVIFDNDEAGLRDAQKICESHGELINVTIPQFEGGKDISDAYKVMGKEKFIELFKRIIKESRYDWENELPF